MSNPLPDRLVAMSGARAAIRTCQRACTALLGGLALGQVAQALAAPPMPPPPLSACVGRYGYTGCAGRLYAQLLCEIVGRPVDLPALEARLQQQFVAEQIDFKGIAVAQVEAAAVRYHVPQVCPDKQQQIWSLLLPQ